MTTLTLEIVGDRITSASLSATPGLDSEGLARAGVALGRAARRLRPGMSRGDWEDAIVAASRDASDDRAEMQRKRDAAERERLVSFPFSCACGRSFASERGLRQHRRLSRWSTCRSVEPPAPGSALVVEYVDDLAALRAARMRGRS